MSPDTVSVIFVPVYTRKRGTTSAWRITSGTDVANAGGRRTAQSNGLFEYLSDRIHRQLNSIASHHRAMTGDGDRRFQRLDSAQRFQPDSPFRRTSGIEVRQVPANQAIAGVQCSLVRHPNGNIRCRVAGCQQDLRGAPAQFESGLLRNPTVRVHHACVAEENSGLAAIPSDGALDRVVEFRDLRLKFPAGSLNSGMAPHVDPEVPKKTVPADVVEMLFRVKHAQLVLRPRGAGVTMDRSRRQCIRAGIDYQGEPVTNDKTRIHAPRRRISETGDSVASVGKPHIPILPPLPARQRFCYDAVLDSSLNRRTNYVSRRSFFASASFLVACSRKRAPRYQAWMFVASAAERAVVVSDLSSFRRSGSIPLGVVPDQVLSARGKLFAVCSASQTVVRIDPLSRAVTAKVDIGGKIAAAALTTTADYLVIAAGPPHFVVVIDTSTFRIAHRTELPAAPRAIAAAQAQAAIVLEPSQSVRTTKAGTSARIARIAVPGGDLLGVSTIDAGPLNAIQYRKDGQTVFVAAPDARQIVSLDAASGSVLARLPVPIRPARFCADGGGGQVFVTGADQEPQLVIFSPYQNQVDQTLYAGRALFGMAVAPVLNLLFLSNPRAGDVTIVEIETRRVKASIRTGGRPGEILIGPSAGEEDYVFVVDEDSGDVSVIHIPAVLHKRGDAIVAEAPKPVFAMFHGGAEPQSAVIVPYSS